MYGKDKVRTSSTGSAKTLRNLYRLTNCVVVMQSIFSYSLRTLWLLASIATMTQQRRADLLVVLWLV